MHNFIGTFLQIFLICASVELVQPRHSTGLGDLCTSSSGARGKCELLSECPEASKDLELRNSFPQICGFKGADLIVCCLKKIAGAKSRSVRNVAVGEKSKQKCAEYGEYAHAQPLLFPGDDVPKVLHVCANLESRLVKPNLANPKEFPHMAAIGFDGGHNEIVWRSSGSLISEQFVLTAAHYLSDRDYGDAKYIRIGDLVLDTNKDDSMPQDFKIIQTFKHPDYKPPSVYNDIALLKLDHEAVLNSYARPACLETSSALPTGKVINTAWGALNGSQHINPHLLKDSLEFVSYEECSRFYGDSAGMVRLSDGIRETSQICAGPHTRTNTCVLGAGGPVQIYDVDVFCTYKICGIASFGKPCGVENVEPVVFTRVSAYIEWIEGIVWP